ncbi:MAG: T9SS type A sorting domain-containing protein [Candidatus Cloacimonetes bacterium]|nr:T9SS type A sorting domain-containing protein [Candidatus Cloacimonadota bacterium]
MRNLIIICIILITFSSILSAQTVNGDTLVVDHKKILRVWGTHEERGYAYGFLMGEEIREVAEDYIIGFVFYNNSFLYENFRSYVADHFEIEEKYHLETEAIVAGIEDSGVDIYSSVLNRDLDAFDILCANCIVDMSGMNMFAPGVEFGCSSLSSWGQSTLADPDLSGALVITRNMDWTTNQTLLNNHLMIINFPAEENEVPWISFTFSGMIGALSAVNQNGIAAFMNMGNIDTSGYEENLHPIFLSIRNGIEMNDYDDNQVNDQSDVYQAIEDCLHLSGSIIHCTNAESGIVVECNNMMGTVLRDESDNSVIPQNNLAATNHFRSLYDPAYCYRYNNISDSLNTDQDISVERSWDLLSGAAGVTSNLHTIQYAPSLNLIKWSTAKPGHPAYTLPPTIFDTEELFAPVSLDETEISIQEHIMRTYPNPFQSEVTISFNLSGENKESTEITIYNMKGQKIRTLPCSLSGVEGSGVEGSGVEGSGIEANVTWNGKDDHDRQVQTGIYLLKLSSNNIRKTHKILFIK